MTENESTESARDYILSNGVYDVLTKIVQIGLPAIGTLYFALASIWGLPNAEQVVGSTAAVSVFLGILLGFSNRSYNSSESKYDGNAFIEPGGDLDGKNQIVLKVKTKLPYDQEEVQ